MIDLYNMEFSEYIYDLTQFDINAPELPSTFKVNTNFVSNIDLSKNFDRDKLPYFAITVNLPNSVHRAIKNAKNTATADITIKMARVKTDSGNVYVSSKDKLLFKTYLSKRFLIFLDNTSISGTEAIDKKYEKDEFNSQEFEMDGQTGSILTLVLYNEQYLTGSNKISYGTISGGDMTSVIGYLCTKAGISNILFSPRTSGTIPGQFVLPPMTLFDQLEYIKREFGIHKDGTVIFFDLERAYIIEKDASCSAYATNEYKKTYIISGSNINEAYGATAGCYDNSNERYYACSIFGNSIPIEDNTAITEHTTGNNLIYVDTQTGNTHTIQAGGGNVNGVVYGVKNTGTYDAYQHSIKEQSNVITVPLQCVNLEALTPNKEFILMHVNKNKTYETTSYRLTSLDLSFSRTDKYYSVNATLILKSTAPRK